MENKIDNQYVFNVLKNSYKKFGYDSVENQSFEFFDGDKEGIIFSCPHAVTQFREGKDKFADSDIGPLGMALNAMGYKVLIKTKNCGDDANYDLKSDYKYYLSKWSKSTI